MNRRALIIVLAFIAITMVAYFIVPSIPGTLRINTDFSAWGSGVRTATYPSSDALRHRSTYHRGKMIKAEWFKPDGTLLHSCDVASGNYTWVFTRLDGSIERSVEYRNGESCAYVYYDDDGNEVDEATWAAMEDARNRALWRKR